MTHFIHIVLLFSERGQHFLRNESLTDISAKDSPNCDHFNITQVTSLLTGSDVILGSKTGGGVAFYVSDRVRWTIPNVPKFDNVEYICLDVLVGRKTFRICNVYRPESPVDWMDRFKLVLDSVCSTKHDLILLGDFNIDYFIPSECRTLNTLLKTYNLT